MVVYGKEKRENPILIHSHSSGQWRVWNGTDLRLRERNWMFVRPGSIAVPAPKSDLPWGLF